MSIIIQFNSKSYIQSAGVPSNIPCRSKTVKLEMVPGIEHSDIPVMTDDEGSIIDIAKNGIFATTLKDVKSSHYCFGLPYQDHNYGAPPPPTPPSYSPCPSPAAIVAIVDEDTNHSIGSTTTEEAPEESVTRCICGFEHDDEYMICCDNCLVWQHVDCMGLNRSSIPETYLCEKCEPRKLDKHKAKLLQARKKVVLTKISPAKQEPSANNLIFGKNYKKKTLPHSPEQWHQTIPTASQPQQYYGSTDSDEECKNNERRPKTRSKRRKREEEKDQSGKKGKSQTKHAKEKLEVKRTSLRRSKNKESTSTADEEAQDAWAYSMEWCEENFESAATNQYTPEVQHLARMVKSLGHEKKFYDQLQSKQCHILDDGKKKQLMSLYDIPRNQPLIEYRGKYLLASQFHDLHPLYNKRLYPYIMFYTVDQTEICVDSSMYGNDARFVRRSCKPNAEIRHMSYNGNLHLFLQSTKVIFSEDEITVPLNFNQCDNIKDIVCACGSEDCFMKPRKRNGTVDICHEKRRRTRRSTISAEDDSNQFVVAVASQETPKVASPIKNEIPEPLVTHSEINEQVIDMKVSSDQETEENSIENKKKMTREQRKIEAYMRAFNQMEKAQRRKQQALERQKSQQPKQEETPEKPEITESVEPKEEEKPPPEPEVAEKEEPMEEEVKLTPTPALPKAKKGKRRRGSGTPSRRRTRTNSGGSEILPTLEEIKQIIPEPQTIPEPPAPIPEPVIEPPTVVAPIPLPAPPSPTPSSAEESPKALKTKRMLLQGWLLEKSDMATSSTASSSSPRSIHTELKWNMSAASATCYVRCTKDTPHSGGISAAHLRRSNSSGHLRAIGGQGSAKKRWLRQAMHDSTEEPLSIDSSSMEHLDSACLSPSCHGDVDSPGASTDDIITPLKKRRLMRESIESLSSPHSPSLENGMDDTDATTSSLTNDTQIDQRIDTMDQQLLCSTNDDLVQLSPKDEENSNFEMNDKLDLAEVDDNEIKEEILEDELSTISTEFVSNKDNLASDEPAPFEAEETSMQIDYQTEKQTCYSPMQTDCDDSPLVNGDISGETIETSPSAILDQDNYIKSTDLNEGMSDPETSTDLDCHPNSTGALENVPLNLEAVIDSNNSAIGSVEAENTNNECILAQKQSPDSCAATIASSPVNKLSLIEIKCMSINPHVLEPIAETQIDSSEKESIEHLSLEESCENHKSNIESPMQEVSNISPINERTTSEVNTVNPDNAMQAVNRDNHSTNNRPPDLISVTLEKTVFSTASSCSNLASSSTVDSCSMQMTQPSDNANGMVLKANGVNDSQVQIQCATDEDKNPVKALASATQKRKVSLSEYRMRMRENTGKSRTKSDLAKGSVDGMPATPQKLPPQVSLAPLPLFDLGGSPKDRANKQSAAKKKKEVAPTDESNRGATEHRENLNERLKREFGFDVSEGPASLIPVKSICNNQTSSETPASISILPLDPQSLPPPPPPPRGIPRPLRPPPTVLGGVPAPIPSQYGFVHPPFSRPPYIPQVPPGASPYIANQPPILPPIHPMPPNPTAQCNRRPPLLPSTHSFAPSMPGTLLRTPTRHDYAPVNAQRFAATMVPQPRLSHKAYPHVYQSGLYK